MAQDREGPGVGPFSAVWNKVYPKKVAKREYDVRVHSQTTQNEMSCDPRGCKNDHKFCQFWIKYSHKAVFVAQKERKNSKRDQKAQVFWRRQKEFFCQKFLRR